MPQTNMPRQLAGLTEHMLHRRKLLTLKHMNDDRCGTSMSKLLSQSTTRRTTQTLGANIAECSMEASRTRFPT